MTDYEDRMRDYVPVNERIAAFIESHKEGSLQSEIVELTDSRVTVKAYAYRTFDDQRPGIGHSSVNIPGSTPYTKGSEIENAETSAWGRAIAALGFEVKRGISSKEEIANKQQRQGTKAGNSAGRGTGTPPPVAAGPSLDQIKSRLLDVASEHHLSANALDGLIRAYVPEGDEAAVRAGLIELGTNIGRGKFDAVPEDMSAEDAIAAGAALVGKS